MFANVDFVSTDTSSPKPKRVWGFEEEIARLSLTNSKFLFFWVYIRIKDYPLSLRAQVIGHLIIAKVSSYKHFGIGIEIWLLTQKQLSWFRKLKGSGGKKNIQIAV